MKSWAGPIILFLGSVISRFWVISKQGMTLPNIGQWRYDFIQMFVPLEQHRFDCRILFMPWQEHRIPFQRLYDLALFTGLGRFDNVFQCRLTAVLFSAAAAWFIHSLCRRIGGSPWPLLLCGAAALWLPFGFENTADAVQVQVYLCLAATLGAAWLFAGGRFLAGLLFSFLGLFTLSSGFVAAPAFALMLVIERLFTERPPVNVVGKCAALALPVIAAQALRVHCPWNDGAIAANFWVFLDRTCSYLSWPAYHHNWLAPLFLAPPAMLLMDVLACRAAGFIERFFLTAWFSLAIQAIIVSDLRANANAEIVSRYMDTFAPLLVINGAMLHLWWRRHRNTTSALVIGTWAYCSSIGIVCIMQWTLQTGIPVYHFRNQCWTQNTLAAQKLNDPEALMQVLPPLRPFVDDCDQPTLAAMTQFGYMLHDPLYVNRIPGLSLTPGK